MSNYTDTLQRGDKIGCYRIEEVLGRGGFAVTYLATDENLDVEVAIKEYLPREITQRDDNLQVSARKPEFAEDYTVGLENFAREAKTLARFKHPHIVRVHQVLHANNTAYMVMDFEQGQELAEILEQRQSLPEEELRAILFPILEGVEEIHRHGFVHRDIKPSNIYIRHNGSPVLIDFGAARYTMSETTQQLTAVVTVGYTPIEQYNVSEDSQGAWSDIYALAAVCYEAVTGKVPTDSVTRASASVTQGDDPLPAVRENAKQRYSDDCLDAIDWGLRMDAEDRPQVIAQWRDAFDGIFNPVAAYVSQKDVSIYSPTRAIAPKDKLKTPTQNTNADHNDSGSDVVSIPLNQTERPLDTGVVSLNANRDSVVTTMPPLAPRDTTNQPANQTAGDTRNTEQASRNVLKRDSVYAAETHPAQPPSQAPEGQNQPRQRSKLERPTDSDAATRRRTLGIPREEIEFDDTDWNYEPPKPPSAWRLVLPAMGLVAVVGASIAYVNFPGLLGNLGGKPDLTDSQKLDLAQQKMNSSELLFPVGESAHDYYTQVLDSDPGNVIATQGVSDLEDAVREKITDNMANNDLSEANRLLARADEVGLKNIYAAPSQQPSAIAETPEPKPVQSDPQGTIVTAVDTAPLQPLAPSESVVVQPEPVTPSQPEEVVASAAPNTGIDNNLSPFMLSQIEEIESLIDQQQFEAARELFDETDKFIADPSLSRRLLLKIEAGEATLASQSTSTETISTSTSISSSTDNQFQAPEPATVEITPEPATVEITAEPVTEEISPEPTTTPVAAPTPGVNIVDTGSFTEQLDQLKGAIQARNMESVVSLSEPLAADRTAFLNRIFSTFDRIDVTFDDVTENGDSASAMVNLSLFIRGDDGNFYPGGKWNNRANFSRENGIWQKIRW